MDDFLAIVREQTDVGRDPRYRDCGGDERCAECTAGYEGKHGFWPCAFHIHEDIETNKEGATGGSAGTLASEPCPSGLTIVNGCYLSKV
jgi:hypothetical protein